MGLLGVTPSAAPRLLTLPARHSREMGDWRGGRSRWARGKALWAGRSSVSPCLVSWGQLKGKVSPGSPEPCPGALSIHARCWLCSPQGTALGSAMLRVLLSFSAWLLSTSSAFPSPCALLGTRLSLILHLGSRAQGQSVAFPARFLCLISCAHLGAPVSSSSSSAADRRALLCFTASKE